ncbi:beta-propeller domain-containing protein [Archangium gephyra]|uniref:beta-propeller domain-containing protein n=1 Tax=Archangium gephyra TaxID=48 RepID=UPI003B75DB52
MTKHGGWALALLGLAACSEQSSSIPKNQPVQLKARLESFESCSALESYIEDSAVLDMRSNMERSKPSYWKGRGGWFEMADGAGAPMPTTSGGAPPGSPGSGPGDHTGTNNQVSGVDEADFVKNDGTRIFVLSGQKLYAHRSWPAESLRVESSLTLEGWPRQMFLHGDKVVVFSGVADPSGGSSGGSGGMADCAAMGPCGSGAAFTKMTTVDVSDLAAPRVTGELYLPGGYHDARLAGSAARLVMRDSFRWPAGIRWWPDYSREALG